MAAAAKLKVAAPVRIRALPCRRLAQSAWKRKSEGNRRQRVFAAAGNLIAPPPLEKGMRRYFSDVLMEVNFSFRLVPRPLTTAMIASEIPAAISPYSIAVAPDSSFQNFKIERFM